jgi:hypothetical protein
MRGVSSETAGVLYALLPVILLGTSAGMAVEPTGPVEISARVLSIDRSGTVAVEVGVLARPEISDLNVRILDASRNPMDADVSIEEGVATYRIRLARAGVHELIVEATASSAAGPVRDEIALRVPLGVRGFAPEDDGEIAAFPLEVRP